MIVDLNNTSEYEKQIIHLDSANGIYNSANAFDFYIKFENPIKNISSVKILEASIVLNTKNRVLSESIFRGYVGCGGNPIAIIYYLS